MFTARYGLSPYIDYVSPLKGYCSAEFTLLTVYYMVGNRECPYQLKMWKGYLLRTGKRSTLAAVCHVHYRNSLDSTSLKMKFLLKHVRK